MAATAHAQSVPRQQPLPPLRSSRRALLVWGAIGALALAFDNPRPILHAASPKLTEARLGTLMELRELIRMHPGGHPRLRQNEPPSTSTALLLRRRFHRLDERSQRSTCRGIDWWRQVDLSTPDAAGASIRRSIKLTSADLPGLDDAQTACSMVISELIPHTSGADNSIAALWMSGLAGTGVGGWQRA